MKKTTLAFLVPDRIDREIRRRAFQERSSLSRVGTEILSNAFGIDPTEFGIEPTPPP